MTTAKFIKKIESNGHTLIKTIEITGLGSVEIRTELDEVVLCGALTIKGDPANCTNKKVSRSKKKAQQIDGVFLKEIRPGYFILLKESCALILHEQARQITLSEQEKREKLVANLKENQEFIDATKSLKLLYEWHGLEMLIVAAENEVRRAFYALNLEAWALDLKRSRENRSDDIREFTNGDLLRQMMAAAEIVGDWFFVPMLEICGYESFEKYHYDTN